ncbi:MAG: dephospho-CoA kinase [Maricaulaceae bacterium]|jgi:dephospho-CoA kinase
MIIVGLTGSIGMGKSTVAQMFADMGVPVFSADDEVHRLYEPGGAGARAVGAAFPSVLTKEGGVDRAKLSALVRKDEEAFAQLEAIVHPLVGARRRRFLRRARLRGEEVAVLDVPLLFETGGDKRVDAVVVVSAPAEIQHERVLRRPGMTEAVLEAILARQTPDSIKRARADHVISTAGSFAATRAQVARVLRALKRRAARNGRLRA